MSKAIPMVELWRGGILESTHSGHAVICDARGDIVQSWGDPSRIMFPRSSCKMVQALPLLESGAADRFGLTSKQIALSCASHQGEALHVNMARDWLTGLDMGEADLRCGAHEPYDKTERNRLITDHEAPCQLHNNCSGKHSGFLTLNKHLGGDSEYTEVDHPLQRAIRQATEEVADETAAGFGIDGCSAPNFAISMHGLARSMAKFAAASDGGNTREKAMYRLTRAMTAHPELVAGDGRACTELMHAMDGRVALKTGAEAVFIAIIPEQKLGLAIKIEDGSSRASEAVLVALLSRLGVLNDQHPLAQKRLPAPQINCRGKQTGELRISASL